MLTKQIFPGQDLDTGLNRAGTTAGLVPPLTWKLSHLCDFHSEPEAWGAFGLMEKAGKLGVSA